MLSGTLSPLLQTPVDEGTVMMHEKEIVDRTRRIETRLTKIGRAMGIDVGGGQPTWDDEHRRVVLPTPNCSVESMLKIIPPGVAEDVDVYVHSEYLFSLFIDVS
jgi:hypothetical protein